MGLSATVCDHGSRERMSCVARTISVHWCAVSSKKMPSWPFSSHRLFHATDELVYASKSRAWLLQ